MLNLTLTAGKPVCLFSSSFFIIITLFETEGLLRKKMSC
jgi:hypothetical protein